MPRSDWGEWRDEEWTAWWVNQTQQGAHPWRRARRRFKLIAALVAVTVVGLFLTGAFLVIRLIVTSLAAVPVVVFVVLVAVGLMVRGAGRFWVPVRRLIDGAEDLASGDYSARVPSHPAGRAMRPVIDSFNTMATRLEGAEVERRRLMADLGHELRTPLTVIRGEVEALIDGVHDPDPERLRLLIEEVDVMERLLEDLATLSKSQAGTLGLHADSVDLGGLVEDIAAAYRLRGGEQNVSVRAIVDGPITVTADAIRIREILANLVVNALRAMPDGGRLTLEAESGARQATIRVIDTGHGIDAGDLALVFDRFHRGPGSGGSGLGLTISRELAEAHGGSLDLVSEPGIGTVATLVLPVVA